jgi:hypothetical protein
VCRAIKSTAAMPVGGGDLGELMPKNLLTNMRALVRHFSECVSKKEFIAGCRIIEVPNNNEPRGEVLLCGIRSLGRKLDHVSRNKAEYMEMLFVQPIPFDPIACHWLTEWIRDPDDFVFWDLDLVLVEDGNEGAVRILISINRPTVCN